MRSDELDFELPPELIAQEPSPVRDASRLLHYRRNTGRLVHRRFDEITQVLRPGDLLVLNDVQVIPARLRLQRETGGWVDGLFIEELRPGRWRVLLKGVGTPRGRLTLEFTADPSIRAVVALREGDAYELDISTDEPAESLLGRTGRMPLPPYIRRGKKQDPRDALDRERYQTVFARSGRAVAAPTAALHFTPALFDALERMGVTRTCVTLHVGMGTFKPLTADTLQGHEMHVERYEVSPETAVSLNAAKAEGRRIVAVGTTSARVLESRPEGQPFEPVVDQTGIFIYPPYRWKHVSALVTNFHLPRSTLVALVAAFVGLEPQRDIYRCAVQERYRFFSYGDAMILE